MQIQTHLQGYFLPLLIAMFLPVHAQAEIYLSVAGTYKTGVFNEGATEIAVYDTVSKKLLVVNADANSVDILSIDSIFNSTTSKNASFDSRSDNKGVAPEEVVVGEINDEAYTFIGFERHGGHYSVQS